MNFGSYMGLIFFCCCQGFLQAESVFLYQTGPDGKQTNIPNYRKVLEQVTAGDRIHFNDGKYFDVECVFWNEKNGPYATDNIFKISSDRVLRVPRYEKNMQTKSRYELGWKALKDYGVRIPKIYWSESNPPHYIQIELIKIERRFSDFFPEPYLSYQQFDEAEPKIAAALKEFFLSTLLFEKIADFSQHQFVFDGEDWILLDWHHNHKLARNIQSKTVVKSQLSSWLSKEDATIWEDLHKMILQARVDHCEAGKAAEFCD